MAIYTRESDGTPSRANRRRDIHLSLVIPCSHVEDRGKNRARSQGEHDIAEGRRIARSDKMGMSISGSQPANTVSPPGIVVYRLGIISGGARANGANIRETPS